MALTCILSAEHAGSPASEVLVEGLDLLVGNLGWQVVGPSTPDGAHAYIGVNDPHSELNVSTGWMNVPVMLVKPDLSPQGANGCQVHVWMPPGGDATRRYFKPGLDGTVDERVAGQVDDLVKVFLRDAADYWTRGGPMAAFTKALEDAEREVNTLLDQMDGLARERDEIAERLREMEAERNQLRALVAALGHQHGCKSHKATKWVAGAIGSVILSLGGGYVAGYAQAKSTPPPVVDVDVTVPTTPQTGNAELDLQLAKALNACFELQRASDDLPPTE